MKTTIFAIITATALNVSTVSAQVDQSELCPVLGQVATSIMMGRQNGLSQSRARQLVTDTFPTTTEGERAIYDVAKQLVIVAWKQPRWHVKSSQQRAIEDFRDEVEALCYGS